MSLDHKGDLDGAITEYREAVRLNLDNAAAHYRLGRALRDKGDLQAALEELRKASSLEPKNTAYRESYEKLQLELKR